MRHSGKPLTAWAKSVQVQILAQATICKLPAAAIPRDLERKIVKSAGRALAADNDREMIFAACMIPPSVREYRFDRTRRWRFDFAWPDRKVALEVEGGVWTEGRHTRGAGFLRDMEKYNRAAVLGWRVVRCTPDTVTATATIKMLLELLAE